MLPNRMIKDFLLLVVILTILSAATVDCAPRCSTQSVQTENCKYGLVKDHCGRDICAKGPGDRCGGKWNYHGLCGDGLFCSCDRCTGCSLHTLKCYDGPACIYPNDNW